jgi:geranylgeranyl reductase family protein
MSAPFDAIVAGAGPAGATAARRLALAGKSVLLLDRARFPRPKACGAGLTGNVGARLDFAIDAIVETRVRRTLCVFREKNRILMEPNNLDVAMVRREPFDALLVQKAVEAGAILREETPVRGVTPRGDHLTVRTDRGDFEARVVIGAEGAISPTGRAAGLRVKSPLGIAMDAEIDLAPGLQDEAALSTAVFDFGVVPRGYGWVFPKRDAFSVGVGTIDARFPEARRHLDLLIGRNPVLGNRRALRIRSAAIPFWTGHELLARDRVFLAGDAAGLVDPLSGEGISYAIRSGIEAARFAAERLDGVATAERGYDEEIERSMARGFRLAHRLANLFFAHPTLCFALGVRSRRINDLFARLIAGEIDYIALHDAMARSWPGRTYRLIKPFLGRAA